MLRFLPGAGKGFYLFPFSPGPLKNCSLPCPPILLFHPGVGDASTLVLGYTMSPCDWCAIGISLSTVSG